MALEFNKEIVGHGSVTGEDATGCQAFIKLHYQEHQPQTISCEIVCAQENATLFKTLLFNRHSQPLIVGRLESGEKLRLGRIMSCTVSGCRATMEIESFSHGYEESLPFESGKYYITIYILDTPIAHVQGISERSYLGTIRTERTGPEGIRWQTPVGEMTLADFYEYEKANVGIEKGLLQVQRCQIRLEGNIQPSLNVSKLFEALENELEDALLVVSFLSRRWVLWYELSGMFIPEDGLEYSIVNVKKRREVSQVSPNQYRECLLDNRTLSEGSFQGLLIAYQTSPVKETLRRAMIFAVSSYERDVLESQIVSIYSAVEALVDGMSKKERIMYSLNKTDFESLSQKLRECVLDFFERNIESLKSSPQEVIDKLPELRRVPLKDRLLKLCGQYGVETGDLWLDGTIPEDGFGEIFRRRNMLIHQGALLDPQDLYEDLVRLRTVAERFVLKLLSLPSEKIWPWAFQDLARVRSKGGQAKSSA